MGLVWKIVGVVVVAVGVGILTALAVAHHAVSGTPVAEVRLAAAMAGLFAGGAALVVVGLVVLRAGAKSPSKSRGL
jgi:hypothetical protein